MLRKTVAGRHDTSWQRLNKDVLREVQNTSANLRISADGAKRGNGEASAGIAFFAYFPDGSKKVFYRAGKS